MSGLRLERADSPGPSCLRSLLAVLVAVAGAFGSAAVAEEFPTGDAAFFERKIRPLLVRRCYECHSGGARILKGGLRLDNSADILRGGDSSPVVVPGRPDESLLLEAVGYESGAIQMPPGGKLPDREIALLREWVLRGAPLPNSDAEESATQSGIDFEAGRRFWSFQPPRRIPAPQVRDAEQVWRPIDAFIIAELEKRGLDPSPPADRRTLIRRAYFDLIGLPPDPSEVGRFVNDPAADAYPRLVERLLASPHYGERWGRYWLDLARYSDKTASWLNSIAQAWLYRDWVVRALNEDLAYDQFVARQLAADLLPDTGPEEIAALGFLGLSPVYWKELKLDPEVIKGTVAEEWEERIDTIGRTFLGLTIACARCHDHKFDPISTEDYYGLAGVLAGTRLVDRPILPDDQAAVVQAARERVQALQEKIKKSTEMKPAAPDLKSQIEALERQIAEIEQATPHYDSPVAHAVDEAALYVLADGPDATKLEYKPGEPLDLHVQVRGNPSNPGPLVHRRFLTVLSDGAPQPFTEGSGRRELAEALVTDAAPLLARVIVNRVWLHHFGRGLVETPSDFGAQGARPTHPELLDDLTARFIENGWSLKWLHREIVLSAAYQQISAADPEGRDGERIARAASLDPENRLLWRMNRRRLEIEAWRDAMLAVAGTLDRRGGGPPLDLEDAANNRRTLYGRVDRYDLEEMLRLYDFPDPLGHSPMRLPTTTALQQLFVLNSPFVQRQARALAERVTRESPSDVESQIRRAYQLLFGRDPTQRELTLGTSFVAENEPDRAARWQEYAQVLLGSNEFLFVD